MHNRREFLKHAALFGAAAAALSAHNLLAESRLMPQPIGDGLSTIRHYGEINRHRGRTGRPRVITIPDVKDAAGKQYKVLKGDFHMHTLFSDGHVMPRDRVLESVDNGFDVISITDHIEYRVHFGGGGIRLAERNDDHNIGYDLAKEEAENRNLILVRGTEITKGPWHFNALFLTDVNKVAEVVRDWRAMLAVSVEQGGYIHWNHPDWVNTAPDTEPGGLRTRGEPMRFFDEIEDARQKGHLHGIEVFNGGSYYPISMDWCNERDLGTIVNSDVHLSEWNAFGHQNPLRAMTLVFAEDRSHDSVREAFFAKRTVGWAANMILGRQPWVEQLFRACVEIQRTAAGLTLRNRSDIPCLFNVNGRMAELLAQGSLNLPATDKLVVSNWIVGMTKMLEITI